MHSVLRESPLSRVHDRASFDCGDETLNTWLARYARQNHESGGSKTFVTTAYDAPQRILGFHSLSPGSIEYAKAPTVIQKSLGRFEIPVYRLGRLAVDRSEQGRGLGGELLFVAARRCMAVAEQVGGVALLIDAKNDNVATWYEGYGAVRLNDAPLSLLLPFSVIEKARSH